jgi:hypothetical protein
MAPTDRPYFNLSTSELEALADSGSTEVLQTIINELGYRKRNLAGVLRQKLESRLTLNDSRVKPSEDLGSAAILPAIQFQQPIPPRDKMGSDDISSNPSTAYVKRDQNDPVSIKFNGRISPRKLTAHSSTRNDQIAPAFVESNDPYENMQTALAIEVSAVREAGGVQSVSLTNGKRIESSADHHIYRFQCAETPTIPDDTPVTLKIGQALEEGSLVSTQGNSVIVSLINDFGAEIAGCQLQVDLSFLIETLRKRYESINQSARNGSQQSGALAPKEAVKTRQSVADQQKSGLSKVKPEQDSSIAAWQRHIPDAILGLATELPDLDSTAWTAPTHLRSEQEEAVQIALRTPITLIWGPPGTGKSTTVAALIAELVTRNLRTLVVSNTNLAVDGLLRKLATAIRKESYFQQGAIVRHGRMTPEKANESIPGLTGSLGDYVILERIVARLSVELTKRKDALLAKIAHLEESAAATTKLRIAFNELERVQNEVSAVSKESTLTEARLAVARREVEDLPNRLNDARSKLDAHINKGMLQKLFSGTSEQTLQDHIASMDQQIQDARRDAAELPDRVINLRRRESELKLFEVELRQLTAGESKARVFAQCALLENDLAVPRSELAEVNRLLAAVELEVLSRCKCIFATSTQVYLKPKHFSPAFDVVIIEEATMLILPAALYAAGLAKRQVVITGDYQQLPAIVSGKDSATRRWLAKDLFDLTGNTPTSQVTPKRARVVMLKSQCRMEESICDLINSLFYDGQLCTITESETKLYPDPLNRIFTIIDTSAEIPFVRLKNKTFSRYSLLHAHAIRNLCVQLIRGGLCGDDIKVMSPYSAQVQVLFKILAEVDPRIQVGTVHRFQGQEGRVVILDICDSHGLPNVSRFISAVDTGADGAKLLNVAISRTQRRLVIVANMSFLDGHLPADAILRDFLHRMSVGGSVIPCNTVFSSRDLPIPRITEFAPEARSVYREDDFEGAFLEDLSRAQRFVVIQSGFLTPQRLAGWEMAFRSLINRNVRIRIITRPPGTQGSIPEERVLEAIDLAQRIGLIVDLRNMIHQKSAIIDGAVVWHGSLNILSFNGKTEESMYRLISPPMAEIEAQFDTVIRRKTREGKHGDLADRENPPCPQCTGISVLYPKGKFGPYLRCLDPACSWKCSVVLIAKCSTF